MEQFGLRGSTHHSSLVGEPADEEDVVAHRDPEIGWYPP
jgi:hypothetical protein